MPRGSKGHSTKSRRPDDGRRRPHLYPGQHIAGVEVIEPTEERVSGSVVYKVKCLGCGLAYKRSSLALKQAAKVGVGGCRQCSKKKVIAANRVRQAERLEEMAARFLAGEIPSVIARRAGVTTRRVRQILAAGIPQDRVSDALKALPAAEVVAAVLALPVGVRRRVLVAALITKPSGAKR